jgi:hypothetical protein
MATKDLSRTVIEGGRHYRNSYERRASHAIERAATRTFVHAVRRDAEVADDSDVAPKPHVYRGFHDKLAPARRWLAKQAGRRWDQVFADVTARFDTRTIAGRHIVHDHLLAMVWRGDVQQEDYREFRFVVDDRGILRTGRWYRRAYRHVKAGADGWRAGRRVGWYLGRWWWFEVVREQPADGWQQARVHAVRPLQPLGRGETVYLERLPAGIRRGIGLDLESVEVLRARRRS